MPPSAGLQRADSCSPAACGPGVFEPGVKGFVVQPPWMPHHLELREKPDMEHMEHSSQPLSIFHNRADARRRQQAGMGDLASEVVDIILDMVWQLETRPSLHQQHRSAAKTPAASNGAISRADADAAISSSNSSSNSAGGVTSGSSGSGSGSSTALQQPEVSWHPAKEEVAAWASYRLVCRQWNEFFRRKSLALRFEAPMSDAQLNWLAAGPVAICSLCFGPGEQRAFRVLGSYRFQAAAAPSLATLRGVPLSNARDLTTRLSDFSRLRHLHAAGGSPALRFADLPPSLRSLEVEGLERCSLRSGLPQGGDTPATAATAAADCAPPLPLPPLTNANLRSTSLVSSDTLQLYPDWLSGLQGSVSVECKDLVLPLPPRQIEGETRFMRVETLAKLLADSSIATLHLHFKEMVLLDFVAAAWPVVVYVLLDGRMLLDTLERNHPGVFKVLKVDGGVTLQRQE